MTFCILGRAMQHGGVMRAAVILDKIKGKNERLPGEATRSLLYVYPAYSVPCSKMRYLPAIYCFFRHLVRSINRASLPCPWSRGPLHLPRMLPLFTGRF
jgi:hypothetical protein